jgi:hypothetical protein
MRALGRFVGAACALCLGAAQAQDAAKLAGESREAAVTLQKTLAGKLLGELQTSGPEAAIAVCKTLAPQAAGDLSRARGWRVTRVSLKVRNPVLGAPDPWEQRVLADFDARAARGEKPDALEAAEIVQEPQGRYFRYARALPVAPLCLNCHGAADRMPAGVRERILKEYPHDRATGYREGEIRGAISVKRPLE